MCNTSPWRTPAYGRTCQFAKEMQVPKTLLIENGDIIKILYLETNQKLLIKRPQERFI